jgi:hypothetical protein
MESPNTNQLLYGSAIEFRYGEFHNGHCERQAKFLRATTPDNTLSTRSLRVEGVSL